MGAARPAMALFLATDLRGAKLSADLRIIADSENFNGNRLAGYAWLLGCGNLYSSQARACVSQKRVGSRCLAFEIPHIG